jgi:hypothetical protein
MAAWQAYHERPGGIYYQPTKARFTPYDENGNYVRGYDEFQEVVAGWKPFGDDEEENKIYRESCK